MHVPLLFAALDKTLKIKYIFTVIQLGETERNCKVEKTAKRQYIAGIKFKQKSSQV